MEHTFKAGEIVRLKKRPPITLNKWDQKRFKDLQGIKFRISSINKTPLAIFLRLINLSNGNSIRINQIMMEHIPEYSFSYLF